MLHWQWKNGHKKVEIWAHVILCALLIHMLLLFFFLGIGGDQHACLMLTLRKKTGFVPVNFREYVVRGAAAKAPPAAHTIQSKPSLKTVKKPAPTAIKKQAKQKKSKPIVPKTVSKKISSYAPRAPADRDPKIEKSAVPQPVVPEKMLPEAQSQPISETMSNLADQITIEAQHVSAGSLAKAEEDQRLALIYDAVSRHWAPPVGIAPDCFCEITVSIGYDRAITKIEISKKSGVLMYDLAARKATMVTTFPLWACGKTITIRFVQ